MTFKELEKKVLQWAEDRNIFDEIDGSNSFAQGRKLGEEYIELLESLHARDLFNIKDGLGDMLVVMILIAEFEGTSLVDCLALAHLQIKDRRGKMVNGLFVKES
jgi:NTP pyrophosphatase (non-canonical NTP hydrolase)